ADKNREYSAAALWLERIRMAVGVAPDRILMVPGNHDVDRKLALKGTSKDLHTMLREGKRQVEELLVNPKLIKTVWPKLGAFSKFAAPYCPSMRWGASQPFWTQEFQTHLGKIVVVGLNTALLSFDDGDRPENLALGQGQILRMVESQPQNAL